MSVSSRPSLSSFTQSEDYKHLRSRSEELTHREDDCHLHDFDSSHLTPRKIKSTVCLNKPTHPGDDCHPHAFQLIPLPNSRNTKSLKLLLLEPTQRRDDFASTPSNSFHPIRDLQTQIKAKSFLTPHSDCCLFWMCRHFSIYLSALQTAGYKLFSPLLLPL